MKKHSVASLLALKNKGEKITALTAYDASFAKLFDAQGVEIILVGDSLGMVLKGENDTLGVTTQELAYHTKCVANGVDKAFVIADMPFMSYCDQQTAFKNAASLMRAGANMVKVEGGEWLIPTIKALVERSVPICGHLGLTPQSVHVLGGFKVQGREQSQAEQMLSAAVALEQAGIQLLVLECVPEDLAQKISESLSIPVIGIGAGVHTDGQVLVMHDMLGVSANYVPSFSRNFLAEQGSIVKAVASFVKDVKEERFPSSKESFS